MSYLTKYSGPYKVILPSLARKRCTYVYTLHIVQNYVAIAQHSLKGVEREIPTTS